MPEHFSVLALLGVAILLGYYVGKLARLCRLPSLIGYMAIGVMLGPSFFNFFSEALQEQLSFITEIALGFVAFSIGSELSMIELKRLGYGIITVIFAESFFAFFFVLVLIYIFFRDLPLALIFAAMAPASAPAGTVAVIQEYKARGTLTKALYAVVGFDDGLAILIFGFAATIAKGLLIVEATGSDYQVLPALLKAGQEIILSFIIGGVIGIVLCQIVKRIRDTHEILTLIFGCILIATGISIIFHLSLILTNMMVGFIVINTAQEGITRKLRDALLPVMPLLFLLFFSLAGAHLNLSLLPSLGLIGIIYIISRASGLILGARYGSIWGKLEEKIKKYLGLGILSQAGVAIGLALIVKQDFSSISPHSDKIGVAVITTVTATSIFFEIIGPILTKIGLQKAGEIPG